MKKKSELKDSSLQFITDVGIPNRLIRDGATEEDDVDVRDIYRRHLIKSGC